MIDETNLAAHMEVRGAAVTLELLKHQLTVDKDREVVVAFRRGLVYGARSARNWSAVLGWIVGVIAAVSIGAAFAMACNQVDITNLHTRTFHLQVCSKGDMVGCMEAVDDEGADSARCNIYRAVYLRATGTELPEGR